MKNKIALVALAFSLSISISFAREHAGNGVAGGEGHGMIKEGGSGSHGFSGVGSSGGIVEDTGGEAGNG